MGLRVAGISKRFGQLEALKGISFELPTHCFAVLLGRNGVGKSTLMKILMREEAADTGSATVAGLSLDSDHPQWGAQVITVSEGFSYPLRESVGDFLLHYGRFFPSWDASVFQRLMARFGVPAGQHILELSRGQQVQVRLVAALAAKPKVILLDEVTAVLDARARQSALKELKRFTAEGGAVLLATNIASEVSGFATQTLVLEDGRLALNRSLKELDQHYLKVRLPESATEPTFLSSLPWVKLARNRDGSQSFITQVDPSRRPTIPDEFTDRRSVTIEDVFLFHTGVDRPSKGLAAGAGPSRRAA
jgi:ABC-2 type transport system ATP-binding protein